MPKEQKSIRLRNSPPQQGDKKQDKIFYQVDTVKAFQTWKKKMA